MYVVIFSADINKLDDEYAIVAADLRKKAIEQYGCTGFRSVSEGGLEIAISYWPSMEAISLWRNDLQHKEAKNKGLSRWYSQTKVEIAKLCELSQVSC